MLYFSSPEGQKNIAILFQWMNHEEGSYRALGKLLGISEATAQRIAVRGKSSPKSMREPVAEKLLEYLETPREHLERWLAANRPGIDLDEYGKIDPTHPEVKQAIASLLAIQESCTHNANEIANPRPQHLYMQLAQIALTQLSDIERRKLIGLLEPPMTHDPRGTTLKTLIQRDIPNFNQTQLAIGGGREKLDLLLEGKLPRREAETLLHILSQYIKDHSGKPYGSAKKLEAAIDASPETNDRTKKVRARRTNSFCHQKSRTSDSISSGSFVFALQQTCFP